MICKKGGFICQRHNEVRDITYEMMSEVCKNVEKEPVLQPLTGENLKYKSANKQDNARLDLSSQGFWTTGERAFFDIRVFDPVAPSHVNLELDKAHEKHEREKRRSYEERIQHVEHGSFSPLVFSVVEGIHKNGRIDSKNAEGNKKV